MLSKCIHSREQSGNVFLSNTELFTIYMILINKQCVSKRNNFKSMHLTDEVDLENVVRAWAKQRANLLIVFVSQQNNFKYPINSLVLFCGFQSNIRFLGIFILSYSEI